MNWLVYPIKNLLEWTFTFIPDVGGPMNLVLMFVIGMALLVWTALMFKFQKDEVPNSPDNPL